MYCKSCGHKLNDPEYDLHDPEGLSEVAQDLGIAPANEDAHLIVRDGEKGWRYYCSENGQVTSIEEEPPGKGNREGEGPPPKEESEQPKRESPKRREGIYDLPEEKSPIQVLAEVVSSPFLGLNEDQISEVRDWAEDYNGQLPPDMLESILGNMSGVQKQAAALARQKYEVKLNKWVQERAEGDKGPPIGVTAQPRSGQERGSDGGGRSSSAGSQPQRRSRTTTAEYPTDDLRRYRRIRRTERRNDAADIAAEEAARQIAKEMSGEFAKNFGRYFSLPAKVLEAKAEKDPDWFFEKLEQWDIDLDAFLEPSESRKQEMVEDRTNEVDREADRALEQTRSQHMEPVPVKQEELFDDEEEDIEEESGGMFDELEASPGGAR